MPQTPDSKHGPSFEEGVYMEETSLATEAGEMRYASGRWSLYDSTGEYDPRSGSGISEAQHKALDALQHFIAEDSHQQITRSGGRVSNVTHWTDSGETTKIREMVVTRSSGKVSQVDLIQYDGTGTEKVRITGTVTRSGGRVDYIDWVETVA